MNMPVSGFTRLMPWSSRISPGMGFDQNRITPPACGEREASVALSRASAPAPKRGTRVGLGSRALWRASSAMASTSDSTTNESWGSSGFVNRRL